MQINKHGSFYMRTGWGTKIINAINEDPAIFAPAAESDAVDNIGLGRIMIKALRYWSDALGLTEEERGANSITKVKTNLFNVIEKHDKYFQKSGTLFLMQRELARNLEDATAWYWVFNEFQNHSFDKDEFVEGFHSYLAINGVNVKKAAVEKEFNCLKNTYIGDEIIDKRTAMDEDTYPFLAPIHLLKVGNDKRIEKNPKAGNMIPFEVLLYSIAMDNSTESQSSQQISIDKLMEERMQVGKYFCIKYQRLIDLLMEAENNRMLILSNNFGNRHIEFIDYDYSGLLDAYYEKEVTNR